jgi:hypothetical protein
MNDLKDINVGVSLDRQAFERVGDLINIEGPLLTLFQNKQSKDLLLYDWMDNDEHCNRYIIYKVAPKDILAYLSKKITHLQLFSKAENGVYFYADIDRRNLSEYKIYRLKSLPKEYTITENNYFSEEYCSDTEGLLLLASRTRAAEKSENSYESIAILESKLAERGLTVSRRGANTIYAESIKTKEAHVRQSYNIPSDEGLEVPR